MVFGGTEKYVPVGINEQRMNRDVNKNLLKGEYAFRLVRFFLHFNLYWSDEFDRRLPVHSHYASPLLLVPTSDSATLNQGEITATVSSEKYPIEARLMRM